MNDFNENSEITKELFFVSNVKQMLGDFIESDSQWLTINRCDEQNVINAVNRLMDICRQRSETNQNYIPILEELKRRYLSNEMRLFDALNIIYNLNGCQTTDVVSSTTQSYNIPQPQIMDQEQVLTYHDLIDKMIIDMETIPSNNVLSDPQTLFQFLQQNQEFYFTSYGNFIEYLRNELESWLLHQRKFMFENVKDTSDLKLNLNELDSKISKLMKCMEINKMIWTQYNICFTNNNVSPLTLSNWRNKLINFEMELAKLILVFEEQPTCIYPLNIITKSKFECKLRLIGYKRENSYLNVNLKVKLYDFNDFIECMPDVENPSITSTIILNKDLQIEITTPHIIMELKELIIKKRPPHSQQGLAVFEQRYILLAFAEVTMGNAKIKLFTYSMPFTIVAKRDQESFATNLWDMRFAQNYSGLYTSPSEMSWTSIKELLLVKFKECTLTTLTINQINFIRDKLFLSRQMPNDQEPIVTWNQFTRKVDHSPIPFSFWEWFISILNLVSDKQLELQNMWANDLIMGFISEAESRQLLDQCQNQTFLLRFSETYLGSITVLYKSSNGEMVKIRPWNIQDLKFLSLSERIMKFTDIKIIYPNHRKEIKFKHYIVETQTEDINGYVREVMTLYARNVRRNITHFTNYIFKKLKSN